MSQIPLSVLEAFRNLGLSEKQLKVIEALYTFGQSKVHDLAQHTKPVVKRSEVYNVLERLVEHKLVHIHKINNVAYYELKGNADIIRWAKKRYIQAEKKYMQAKEAVDKIKKFLETRTHQAIKSPSFHHFNDIKGIQLAHGGILKKVTKVRMYLDHDAVCDACPDFVEQLHCILKEAPKLTIRCILPINTPEETIDKLRHSQLFLRTKSNDIETPNPLIYAGETWMVNFNIQNNALNGLYMTLPDANCMKLVLNAFERDWEEAQEPEEN